MSDERPSVAWRARFLAVVVCGCWLILSARLVQLQWFSRHRAAEQIGHQSTYLEEVAARPGDIFDRDGRVLATTIAAKSFFVVPNQLTRHPEQWELVRRIADVVGQNADALQARIAEHNEKHFLWVRRRIRDTSVLDQLNSLKLPRDLAGFRDEFLRQYPQGHLAAHVLGGRDVDGIGRGGIEQSLNERLAGQSGDRRLVLDSRSRVIDLQTDIEAAPRHGQPVTLTLDTVIQLFVEEELDRVMEKWRAKHAAAIVLDPKTGEVLAMASRPTYDPNDLTRVSDEAWKNQAVAAMYEPGSTFKPFIVGWAVEQRTIRRDESFHCENGEYQMGSRLLHDHHPYGLLSLTDVLVKSSNIGMAKIGQRMGNAELFQAAVTFGFGRRTGIELPGELSGMLHPLRKWTSYSTGSIPMGQEFAVTPMQLIAAHAALANGGTLISPHLIHTRRSTPYGRPWADKPKPNERTADADAVVHPISLQVSTTIVEPSPHDITFGDSDRAGLAFDSPVDADLPATSAVASTTISPDICQWIIESVMAEVIKRGTGKKARLDDYTVFGKTGTAQKRDPVTGKYSNQLHVSSFVGGAPAANPRVMVLVLVDEPSTAGEHFGGDIAAPPAGAIIHKALMQLGVPAEQEPAKTASLPESTPSE